MNDSNQVKKKSELEKKKRKKKGNKMNSFQIKKNRRRIGNLAFRFHYANKY